MSEQAAYERAEAAIQTVYESNDGNETVMDYHDRHGINSLLILTISDYYCALQEIEKLWPRIKGKTVVEIGAGVGMLAIQMAKFAKRVYAIEADPAWSWVFTDCLYEIKPPNLSFIFGRAQDFAGLIRGDVAIVYTRSDVDSMRLLAAEFAPEVIMGPLVEFEKRHNISDADREFVERVAARLGDALGLRGFDATSLQEAIDAEAKQERRAGK